MRNFGRARARRYSWLLVCIQLASASLVMSTPALAWAQTPGTTAPADAATAPPLKESAESGAASADTQAAPADKAQKKKTAKERKGFLEKLAPIAILLVVVMIVLVRLPKAKGIDHDKAYRTRRVMNWLPLGLTYMFLYMGRYNLTVSKRAFYAIKDPTGNAMMANADFATIFAAGTIVYGCSFLINGPLTDKLGGKFAILVGAGGAMVANLLMGLCTMNVMSDAADGVADGFVASNFLVLFSVLYSANMYFQSFGAVAIVKCNSAWFHVRERGTFGAIFGILISLGVYFAFDVGFMIMNAFELQWLFLTPAIALGLFWVIDVVLVRNNPSEAGLQDIDTGDASSGDDGPQRGALEVMTMMFKNPVIITIALVEFCSGFLRQAIMQWYRTFADQTNVALDLKVGFVYGNWGLLLCCAGIMGGVFAGTISDHVFDSRRGPVAAVLYAMMLAGAIVLTFTYTTTYVGWIVVFMSMAVIGVHGMLSGTASMDFGGKKNVGIAVGIIDGFVYAGTGFMSILYGIILPNDNDPVAAANPENWQIWPISMIPVALIGLLLTLRLWNAKPKPKSA